MSASSRILVVTSSWPRTGDEIAGTFVRSDAIARAGEGSRVFVAAPAGPGVARGGRGIDVVEVAHGGLFGSPGAMQRFVAAPWRIGGLALYARDLAKLIERVRPTRLIAHWLVPIAGIAAALADAPLEVIAHGGDVRLLEAMPGAVSRRYITWLCERTERVRVVSSALARRLALLAPRHAGRLDVEPMPTAIDDTSRPSIVAEGARLRATIEGRPLHVVASRLAREKQVDRAIAHVRRVGGSLVIVGDGPERAKIDRVARTSGVDVRMIGARPHEEALSWIAAADVVVAPVAKGEGAPTVIREARALDKTVVVV